MPITEDNLTVVRNQVEYLVGCYPNIHWDIEMSASSWLVALIEIQASEEEFINACHWIVINGIEEFKVNIALITDLILQDRKIKQNEIKTNKHLEDLNNKKTISPEIFKKYKQMIYKEMGYSDEKK